MWKTLKENHFYEVSEEGVVRRRDNQVIIHGFYTNGFHTVKLCYYENKQKVYYVHRLVAEHFIENPDPKVYTRIIHIDGNNFNNRADNLKWATAKESLAKQVEEGKRKKKPGKSWVPVNQYDWDGNFVASYPSIAEASRQTGITARRLWRAIHGHSKGAEGFHWEKGSTTTQE